MRLSNRKKDISNTGYLEKRGVSETCLNFKNIVFEGSFNDTARLLGLPQFAFAGRSNVGKSSLINAILNRKIAYVSKNPGKTTLINAIKVNELFYLIDLPGYGYAKRSKSQRNLWKKTVETYLKDSNLLYHVFVLIDSRHRPMYSDYMLIECLQYYNREFSVVFTKTDKTTQKDISLNITYLKKLFGDFKYFLTSSKKGRGIDRLCNFIRDRL